MARSTFEIEIADLSWTVTVAALLYSRAKAHCPPNCSLPLAVDRPAVIDQDF
jgi:hypothetical protein